MSFIINKIDKSNMKKSIYSFPFQIEEMLKNYESFNLNNKYNNITNILILGMGGSAIGAEVCKVLISKQQSIPIIINRNYIIPKWVDKNTLVIASSYSGETEETIEAYNQACIKTTNFIIISTGGKLVDIGRYNNNDIFIIPKNYQPRAAIGYSIMAILIALIKTGITEYSIIEEIKSILSPLKEFNEVLNTYDENNPAIIMAKNLNKTIPVIYGSALMTEIIALRFKGQLQENSKIVSFHNVIPEMNHNEIEGWNIANNNTNNSLSAIWINDEDDHDQIKKRMKISKIILEEMDITNYIIKTKGSKFKERFLKLISYTDWISYYLAIINNRDPSPVDKITKLKRLLK